MPDFRKLDTKLIKNRWRRSEDYGQGCKDVKPGFGIHHLTERIDLLQGRIRYYGVKGFELIVEIPMRRGENNG